MELLIIFGIVGIPLIAFGFYAKYKAEQEERKEKGMSKGNISG